jgi:hypothetical protein
MNILIVVFALVLLVVLPILVTPIASGVSIALHKTKIPFTAHLCLGAILGTVISNEVLALTYLVMYSLLVFMSRSTEPSSFWNLIGMPISMILAMQIVFRCIQVGGAIGLYTSISIIGISTLLEFGAYKIYTIRYRAVPGVAVSS